jgi:hypothetical protein
MCVISRIYKYISVCVFIRAREKVQRVCSWMDELGGSSDIAPVTPCVVAPTSPPPHAHTIMHTRFLLPRQPQASPSSAMHFTALNPP